MTVSRNCLPAFPLRPKLRVDPRHRNEGLEVWVEEGLVRAGLMRRTSREWGFPLGLDNPNATLLLRALRTRAADRSPDIDQAQKGKTAEPFLDRIDALVARYGVDARKLAEDLKHDIALWEPYWRNTRNLRQIKVSGAFRNTKRFRPAAPTCLAGQISAGTLSEQRRFPAAYPGSTSPGDHRPKPSDKNVRSFLKNRVANWPDDKCPPNEREDWQAARSHFQGDKLTRDEFRLVRNQETPEPWRKQGKRLPWGQTKARLG